ncbi:MAG: hypothetical protein A2X18_02200 [Bacteroidetes bacterium GWF2_40_14]|nr:MAG: hypothetical protein A2X18_02200 [Bacteroidetes bacterium GWF2_40_14]
MKKELLLKYIKGEVSKAEESEIFEWIERDPENKKYFLLLNNLWISQNISDEKATPEELREIQSLTTKKNLLTTKKKFSFNGIRRYLPYAAAIFILMSISLNLFLINNSAKLREAGQVIPVRLSELRSENKHEIYTEKGVKARITLPDGSKVWLNSDSKITFPDKFESDIREIAFSGEAYFDVTRDSLRPMIITTNKNFKIEVLGTKFNIRSYDNDSEAQMTLYSGSINVVSASGKRGTTNSGEVITKLKPLETCIIRERQTPVHLKPVNAEKQVAWKNGKIIFESTPMSEVLKILERWHGTQFIVKDQSVYKFDITAKFRSESIVQIMEMIKYCSLVDYTVDSNKVILMRR